MSDEVKKETPPQLKSYVWKKGDPRAAAAGKKNGKAMKAKLLKRLKAFDEKAWGTLANLFEAEDPHLALEALRIWAKYRLHCLTLPEENSGWDRVNSLPRMSPEFAKRVMEALDS
jgi:hypothetical protein